MEGNGLRQAIHITLRGKYNITYSGTLILHGNLSTSGFGNHDSTAYNNTKEEEPYDATGASYFVVAVVLVYGMSIVALIASHIKRRHDKITEDKQIDKYLQDFQIIKEVHARDNYKNLKKSVMNKINWDRKKGTHRTLQKSILPLLAIGMQVGSNPTSMETLHQQEVIHKAKRKVYPIGTKRHSDPDISDSTKLIEVVDPRPLRVRRHSCMDKPYLEYTYEQAPPLDLLTIPDAQYYPGGGGGGSHGSLNIPSVSSNSGVGAGGSGSGSGNPDSASVRRLRFSSSNISVSTHLDRSLNSIAEREEDEYKDITPPQPRRPSIASSSGGGSLPTPQTSLELPAITTTPAPISKAAKLRRIGVCASPPADDIFPDDAHCLPSIPTITTEEDEISIVVDEVFSRESEGAGDSHANAHNDNFMPEDADTSHMSRGSPLIMSYPVSIMVEEDDDEDMIDDLDSEPERVDSPNSPRRTPMSRRASSFAAMESSREEEDFRLTPQTLLASIKFTGGTLTPNGSPRRSRSRSASITSLMSRRGSKDRRRSAVSIGHDSKDSSDSVIEVTEVSEDNPLQITCL